MNYRGLSLVLALLIGGLSVPQALGQHQLNSVELYLMDFDMRYQSSLFESEEFKRLVLDRVKVNAKGFEHVTITDGAKRDSYQRLRDKLERGCCETKRLEWFDFRMLVELSFSDGHVELIGVSRLCDDCPADFNGHQCYQMREILRVALHDIRGKVTRKNVADWLKTH